MRILVTGGAGFIGSHVADGFRSRGHEVAVVDDLSNGDRANLDPSIKLYQIDIRDTAMESVFQDFRPEIVDHHAEESSCSTPVGLTAVCVPSMMVTLTPTQSSQRLSASLRSASVGSGLRSRAAYRAQRLSASLRSA